MLPLRRIIKVYFCQTVHHNIFLYIIIFADSYSTIVAFVELIDWYQWGNSDWEGMQHISLIKNCISIAQIFRISNHGF